MRIEKIGLATLYLGDCLEIMPNLQPVAHLITDPPYEKKLHDSMKEASSLRVDGGAELKALDFDSIDEVREEFVRLASGLVGGWFIAFCTAEGVRPWADCINDSKIKYKRACVWVKPDAAPQFNGQGPAAGAEMFIAAWAGKGHARWNAGGKRGVYTHNTNAKDRTGLHSTEKPRLLMRELVADFTNEPDVVLDPFMGSGTTGVAAVELGREFIGIEKNERYFDIACERITEAQRQQRMF